MVREGDAIDLRITVIPTVNGESVMLRILDKRAGLKSLGGAHRSSGLQHTAHQRCQQTIARLIDMGVESCLLSSTASGAHGAPTARRNICPEIATILQLDPSES